jgi:oxazoline/thiazoline dehydrogenase
MIDIDVGLTYESIGLQVCSEALPAVPTDFGPDIAISWPLLCSDGLALPKLHRACNGNTERVAGLVAEMWPTGSLCVTWPAYQPLFRVAPMTGDADLIFRSVEPGRNWRLSRFAYMHLDRSGTLVVQSPISKLRIEIDSPRGATFIGNLAAPRSVHELAEDFDMEDDIARGAIVVLACAGIVSAVAADGYLEEDDPQKELGTWEFHDALFHVASRQGRHQDPMGAHFRFKHPGGSAPSAAEKFPPIQSQPIYLTRPDLRETARTDPPLTAALESRHSVRAHSVDHSISLANIGEFLYRAARNRHFVDSKLGIFASRPYPSGGASYELELYLAINNCRDIDRGIYYYNPSLHALHWVNSPDDDFDGLLHDAYVSAAGLGVPQVLITIASRFRRVAWKYSGIAYSAQLKNVGVLYQTMYLVATAMGLAGCALGLGNSERFARLTRNEYFAEGSIGEFTIGIPEDSYR